MMSITPEAILLILFGSVIVFLLLVMKIMHTRIYQLLEEVDKISGKMNLTSNEIEQLTKNVEEFKTKRI
jgi:cell division protein FtsL